MEAQDGKPELSYLMNNNSITEYLTNLIRLLSNFVS
jgi:hypothetical protein